MRTIAYRRGYKYQLAEDFRVVVDVRPDATVTLGPITLTPLEASAELFVKEGYAWDGPSGPTFDTRDFMRGALAHDALYQLLQWDKLGPEWKDPADRELQRLCLEDGMPAIRAWWVYWGVRLFGRSSTRGSARGAVLYAP